MKQKIQEKQKLLRDFASRVVDAGGWGLVRFVEGALVAEEHLLNVGGHDSDLEALADGMGGHHNWLYPAKMSDADVAERLSWLRERAGGVEAPAGSFEAFEGKNFRRPWLIHRLGEGGTDVDLLLFELGRLGIPVIVTAADGVKLPTCIASFVEEVRLTEILSHLEAGKKTWGEALAPVRETLGEVRDVTKALIEKIDKKPNHH